jgi:hypothetical protein
MGDKSPKAKMKSQKEKEMTKTKLAADQQKERDSKLVAKTAKK